MMLEVWWAVFLYVLQVQAQPTVKLGDGATITGQQVTVEGKTLSVYLGIPFARPPLGELRFREPRPLEAFPRKFEATHFGPTCIQKKFDASQHQSKNMSEDCLHLNLWVPNGAANLSTLVYIYGGAFEAGDTDQLMNNPQRLAARGNIIVASVNYRVGSLGFLDIGVEGASGNLGLFDQRLAFIWIKNSIKYFGGNPNMITLYGSSAGAMSIGFHLSSNLTKGLFNRVFMQSGVSNTPFLKLRTKTQNEAIKKYYEILNCPIDDKPGDKLKCLQSKSIKDILSAENEIVKVNLLNFHPHFGNTYFNISSYVNYKPELVHPSEVMISYTKDEGSAIIPIMYNLLKKYEFFLSKDTVVNFAAVYLGLDNNDVIKDIFKYYLKDSKDNITEYVNAFKKIAEDLAFKCPAFYFANLMSSRGNKVYFYEFTYQTEYRKKSNETRIFGVSHTDDFAYVMGLPLRDQLPYLDSEKDFSNDVIDLVSSFVKEGTPRSKDVPNWPVYTHDTSSPLYSNTDRPLVLELHPQRQAPINIPQLTECSTIVNRLFFPST